MEVVKEFGLVEWIKRKLQASLSAGASPAASSPARPATSGKSAQSASTASAGECDDEGMLLIIMLLGTICTDEVVAKMALEGGLLLLLIEILNGIC